MLRPLERWSRGIALATFALLVIVGARLWLAYALPLTDTTEARFAEMGRKMVATGDWLVPQHDFGVPYLAKPPLAMWLAAAGIDVLGANELAPRILILAVGLAFCALFYRWLRHELGVDAAWTGLLAMMSSLVFFVSLAAVMTDLVLTVSIAVALLAFWRRYRDGPPGWEVAMYLALGLGLRAKGPLATVLFLASVGGWALLMGRIVEIWRRFAWLKGALLALAVAAPWYAAAEWRNSGFLEYFIVGEHIKRFLVPNWSGDLYGRAHDAPRGTIWLFFLIGTLPWSVVLGPALVARRAALVQIWNERRELIWFGIFAALAPLALFTFAGNVIFPYALPAIPGAVIAAVALTSVAEKPLPLRSVSVIAAATAVVLVALVVVGARYIDEQTQRSVVTLIERTEPGAPIYYWRERYFSADYYSGGTARVVMDLAPLEQALDDRECFFLVVRDKLRESLDHTLPPSLVEVRNVNGYGIFEPDFTTCAVPPPDASS